MSIAITQLPSAPLTTRPTQPPAPSTRLTTQPTSLPNSPALLAAKYAAPQTAPLQAVPAETTARGFVLYVGLNETKAAADGTSLHRIVEALRALTAEIAPSAETHAAVALAPAKAGGRDVDVVRLALHDPAALAEQRGEKLTKADRHPEGVIIDISRKRVLLDGEHAGLTYKEFELLQFLVLREGRTVERQELVAGLWSDADPVDIPSERTIDVHVRRLRSKLANYQDIIRTVRGSGYRFDRHADVLIHQASTPSPDIF